MKHDPTFTVYCGCMFGGKTVKLLSDVERFELQHREVALYKAALDDRYDRSDIVSHSGWRRQAVTVRSGAEILQHLSQRDEMVDVVAVDEAFMVDGIADALVWLFRRGASIVVSSLDMSYTGKPFLEITRMLPWATHVEKCTAVCVTCGRDARYTHKKVTNDDDLAIEVGGSELYEPRCARCHPMILDFSVVRL